MAVAQSYCYELLLIYNPSTIQDIYAHHRSEAIPKPMELIVRCVFIGYTCMVEAPPYMALVQLHASQVLRSSTSQPYKFD